MNLVSTYSDILENYKVISKSFEENHSIRGRTITTKYKYAKTLDDWDFPKERGELVGFYSVMTGFLTPNLYLVGEIIERHIDPLKKGITKRKKITVDRISYDIKVLASYNGQYKVGDILNEQKGIFVRVCKID